MAKLHLNAKKRLIHPYIQMSYCILHTLQYECVMCEEKHYHTKRLFVVRDLPGYQVTIKITFLDTK